MRKRVRSTQRRHAWAGWLLAYCWFDKKKTWRNGRLGRQQNKPMWDRLIKTLKKEQRKKNFWKIGWLRQNFCCIRKENKKRAKKQQRTVGKKTKKRPQRVKCVHKPMKKKKNLFCWLGIENKEKKNFAVSTKQGWYRSTKKLQKHTKKLFLLMSTLFCVNTSKSTVGIQMFESFWVSI